MFRQMEKLIELLNEYETPRSWVVFKSYDDYDGTFYWVDIDWETEIAWSDSYICGKRFGFIKWLVENEKIADGGIKPRENLVKEISIIDWETNKPIWWENQYSEWEHLIMYLSIQDKPIEFLVSILK